MNNLDMKNIIVLKDLPSNIIDEAIVILKDNKLKKKENSNVDKNIHDNIISEAESVISEYIEKLEQPKKEKQKEMKLLIKYKKLQTVTIFLFATMIISIIINFIK